MTLEDELKVVKEYFYIQKTRFGDRVSFEVNCDSDNLSYPIPCLTLQPIVENAFVHGIEEVEENAKIVLNICEKNNFLQIDICDNGVGMDEKTRVSLMSDEETDDKQLQKGTGHSTGIGMKNVRRRLEIYYQQKNLVEVISSPGEGTIVRLTLPINIKGEKNDDKGTNR
jgi:sensor histidine kinase YesM